MAPTAPPKKRSSKPSNPLLHTRTRPSSTFINSKSDKRLIKHSSFVSRIEKTSKKPLKRRRPSKKLVTTMEGLADALPDVEQLVKRKESGKEGLEVKSLSHGRGFMKRRDKVEKGERERFGRNLGVIMASKQEGGDAAVPTGGVAADGEVVAPAPVSTTAGRFAAIRAWVNVNVEKHEGFEKKS